MSQNPEDLTAGENSKVGPDFFGFCTNEVAELLSHDELGREKVSTKNSRRTKESNGISGSGPLFSNGIGGALLSELKRERLKSLLRQSVCSLTQEVDELVDPILSVCRIQTCLKCKESLLSLDASEREADQAQHPHKKLKVLPACSDLENGHMHVAVPGKALSDDGVKKCIECHATRTPQWRSAPDGTKSLCNACGLRYAKTLNNRPIMNSDIEGGKGIAAIDEDLRFLLENDTTKVEELIENQAKEFSATLHYMEQKLEELLNVSMTSCRPMTHAEKQQLRKFIQNLTPQNLNRVVEIIGQNKPSEELSSNEVLVDLEELDNVTLWRLYYFVRTVQASTQ